MTLYSSVASIHIMCTCVPMLVHLITEILVHVCTFLFCENHMYSFKYAWKYDFPSCTVMHHHYYLFSICLMMLSVIQTMNIKVTTILQVFCIVGLIPQSFQLQAELTLASVGLRQVMRVHADQCVSTVRVVAVSVVICLCNTCNHVTEEGGL